MITFVNGEQHGEVSDISNDTVLDLDFTGVWSAGLFPLLVILSATGAIICFTFSFFFPPDSLIVKQQNILVQLLTEI